MDQRELHRLSVRKESGVVLPDLTRLQQVEYEFIGFSYIIWRRGTGDNVEITHLKVVEPRKGIGTQLFRTMLRRLEYDPPYATVFVFTRVSNEAACQFYYKMGLKDWQIIEGIYADGQAVLFSGNYKTLLEIHDHDQGL